MRPHYSSSLLRLASGVVVNGIPKSRTVIILWGDKDRSEDGQNTVNQLAERLTKEGYIVQVHIPEMDIPANAKSVDWLDVYVQQGPEGFPVELDETVAVDVF
jgi:putative DNA primase/helicase